MNGIENLEIESMKDGQMAMDENDEIGTANQEDSAEWEIENEALNALAIHEAGHFVMSMLVTRHPPFHTRIVPEWGWGVCIPGAEEDDTLQAGLVAMGGCAAEAYWKNGKVVPDELAPYMANGSQRDYDNFIGLLKHACGRPNVTEGMLRFVLDCFNHAQHVIQRYFTVMTALAIALKFDRDIDYNRSIEFCREWGERLPEFSPVGFQRLTAEDEAALRDVLAKEEAKASKPLSVSA